MNKYLKILMLSGGLIGAIAPTAINMDKQPNSDLGYIYENIERMQEAIPKLSRINYKLNIDLSNNTGDTNDDTNNLDNSVIDNNSTINENISNDSDVNIDENGATTIEDNINGNSNNIEDSVVIDNSNNNKTFNNNANDSNISFTSTDENGEENTLTKQETLNYLNETLVQTNIEYEELKTTLSNAIKDTMDYLDNYKNGETTLTNEQKIYIKEHTNSIKFLAETLEDLSEEIICCIDGCENCEDEEEFNFTASQYLTTINELETRINALNNAIASLQFVNNIGNPYFFAGRVGPNQMFYGYQDFNGIQPDLNNSNNNIYNDESDISQDIENSTNNDTNSENGVLEVEENSSDDTNNQSNYSVDNGQSTQDDVDNSNIDDNKEINDEEDKPTTFGLKSNIDTYAPTKRNIDTFFNTALYNKNDYMNGNAYGYGYGMPYGYGGGYGYGMPYGQGYYGNPYGGMGVNSNMVNREVLDNHQQNETHNTNATPTTSANIEQEVKEDVKKPKKIRQKRTKNIDTYNGTTIQSNINTMGESKISKFFKEKFNNLRNKVRKQKDDVQDNNTFPQDNLQEDIIKNTIPEDLINPNITPNDANKLVENTNKDEDLNKSDKELIMDGENDETNNKVKKEIDKDLDSTTTNIYSPISPKQEKDIKAQ